MELSLKERVQFVLDSVKRGYIIGHWNLDKGCWIASHENNEIGFFLEELV